MRWHRLNTWNLQTYISTVNLMLLIYKHCFKTFVYLLLTVSTMARTTVNINTSTIINKAMAILRDDACLQIHTQCLGLNLQLYKYKFSCLYCCVILYKNIIVECMYEFFGGMTWSFCKLMRLAITTNRYFTLLIHLSFYFTHTFVIFTNIIDIVNKKTMLKWWIANK